MVDIAKIETLMLLMTKHGFDVVSAESNGEKISLAKNAAEAHFFPHHEKPYQPSNTTPQANISPDNFYEKKQTADTAHYHSSAGHFTKETEEKKLPSGTVITSPFVGTFYRAPGPGTSNFVEIGSRVKKGQSLCIVEAMKLMNEIESEVDGEVVAILLENAKPVEFGTPLFVIA
ncbi:MAG: acetyl-CoA carboxylase biotin carboxyl carrier protein [Silvanigrellaceae bacterium]|nr:acetyl-CoA carboxylase biotin carboxyl carrier protein [Silvanigrellaceae bacterium]